MSAMQNRDPESVVRDIRRKTRRKFSSEEKIRIVLEGLKGEESIAEICRQLGIKEQTYYKWRKEYGGMRVNQAKKLKEVEQENSRLKKLVADLSLDNAILKETVRGNY